MTNVALCVALRKKRDIVTRKFRRKLTFSYIYIIYDGLNNFPHVKSRHYAHNLHICKTEYTHSIKNKFNNARIQFMEMSGDRLQSAKYLNVYVHINAFLHTKSFLRNSNNITFVVVCTCRRLNHQLKCIEGEQHPCRSIMQYDRQLRYSFRF